MRNNHYLLKGFVYVQDGLAGMLALELGQDLFESMLHNSDGAGRNLSPMSSLSRLVGKAQSLR